MAVYVEEEEAWKCPKHPSKRRRSGICPACLRDRLGTLCPDCHHARPCPCPCADSSSSSSSSNFPDGDPSFRRSRSVAATFLRFRHADIHTPNNSRVKTPSFLSVLKRNNTKRGEPKSEAIEVNGGGSSSNDENFDTNNRIEDYARMVTRSRSVNTGSSSAMASGLFRRADVAPTPSRSKFWHFPSPMKVFRSSKTPKIAVQDRPPLHRR